MTANFNPIFGLVPRVSWGTTALTTANTNKDGTGTVLSCFTAGANGSYLDRIRFQPAGTNVATVARVFINNGSSTGTAANNIYWDQVSIPALTNSETAAIPFVELALGFAIPASYTVTVTIGTTIAAGVYVSVVGSDY